MGARISAHRKNKGLTQEALANTLGVSNQAVSKWESDVCCPDIALLPQLVDALEMTLDELFGRESKAVIANDQILPVAAELPWEDDDSIHAVLFQGHRLTLSPARTLPMTLPEQVMPSPACTSPPTLPQVTLSPADTSPPTSVQVTPSPALTLP